jgi:hypothetical protein
LIWLSCFEIGRIEIVAPDGDHAVLDGDCPHDRQRDSAPAVIEDINSLAEHDIPCGGNIDDLELGSEIFAEPEIDVDLRTIATDGCFTKKTVSLSILTDIATGAVGKFILHQ